MRIFLCRLSAAAALFCIPASCFAGAILQRIKTRASLTCGVVKEEEDYSRAEDHGNRAALDLDLCKAVAVATLGEHAKFTIHTFPDEPEAITGLKAGVVDLLPTATPNLAHTDASSSLRFARPVFYDGQGFLVPKSSGVKTPQDLAGKKICFLSETGTEVGLRAYAARQRIQYIWYPFSEEGEMNAAFFTGNCAAVTTDVSQLANTRAIFRNQADQYAILPEIIRKDPLAPAYRLGDAQWAAIVSWTVEALIQAEESGVTQANVDEMKRSDDPEVLALLGSRLGTGDALGLDMEWGTHVIKAVGNYGEIFERDLGSGSPLMLERGANRLWTQGGLMYANPMRRK